MRFLWLSCLTALVLAFEVRGAEGKISLVPATPAAGEPRMATPFGVDFDATGNLFFVEHTGHRLRKIEPAGNLTTLAGDGRGGYSGDDGPAAKARLNAPHSLAIAPNGDIYVADTNNSRLRRIDAKTGMISTFAGTGERGFAGDDGPAGKAQFGNIYCIAFDPSFSRMYLADLDNRRIRMIDMKTRLVKTIAGNAKRGVPRDGAVAADSPLVDPRAVAADDKGNVYVLERGGHALRVVDAQGRIRTVAGTGKPGFSGDGGPAVAATMNGPKHLCIDGEGNVLIADTENHAIRRYAPATGRIERVAGTGRAGNEGLNGDPLVAGLNKPHGVWVGAKGEIHVSDSDNHRVLRIDP